MPKKIRILFISLDYLLDSLRQSPLDGSTRDAVEVDSAVLVADDVTPTQVTDSRVASRIEQDTSLTSVTEFSVSTHMFILFVQ